MTQRFTPSASAFFDLHRAKAVVREREIRLTREQCALLHWLPRPGCLEDLSARLGSAPPDVYATLGQLESLCLVEAAPAESPGAVDSLSLLWSGLRGRYGARPVLLWDDDGSSLGADDVEVLGKAFARMVRTLGDAGVVVGICAPARPESLIAVWGTWLAGGVVAVVDPDRPAPYAGDALRRANAAIVLTHESARSRLGGCAAAVITIEGFADALEPFLHGCDPLGQNAGDGEPAAILFTSGTSGAAKGVVLSRGALFRSGVTLARAYQWGPRDVVLCTAGLYAMSGLRNPCVAALHAGATIVLDAGASHARMLSVSEACRRRGVSVLSTVPAMLNRLAAGHGGPIPPLRMALSTGAPLAPVTAASQSLGFPIYDYYGMTETSGACVLVTPDMHPVVPGIIGRPAGCVAHVLRPDGSLADDGEAGELAILSHNLMLGYLADPAATARVVRGSWLHTGDVVRRRPDGALAYEGRRDEQMKTADGDILYPAEVEAVLRQHAAVRDVCVRSIPCANGQPSLVAFVASPKAALVADVELELRQRVLQALGPRRPIDRIVMVEALPRRDNGKIPETILREMARDE